MAKIKNLKDLILHLLYAKGARGVQKEPILGKVRLMKMIFLFEKELKKGFNKEKNLDEKLLADFKAYDFGPYSEKVYSDLELLVNLGYVKTKKKDADDTFIESKDPKYWSAFEEEDDETDSSKFPREFSLTDLGVAFIEVGKAGHLTKEQKELLEDFKIRCTKLSLKTLLKYVYSKYPEYATESKIKEEILAENRGD